MSPLAPLRLHYTALISVQRNIVKRKSRDFSELREMSFLPPSRSNFFKMLQAAVEGSEYN